jgi:hypothetical protein
MPNDELRRGGSARTGVSDGESSMRARTWLVAFRYYDPSDYDIPALPAWTVTRPDAGGIAFAADDDESPFIRAEQPVRVQR